MRGRKPKPDAVKRLAGNPGKRKLESGPVMDTTLPHCPEHLDDEARAEWRRVARRLRDVGILVHVDHAVLAVYCQAWSRWVKAEKKIAELGETVELENGYVQQTAWMGISNRAVQTMLKAAAELGMTPSARGRVAVAGAPEEEDDLAKILLEAIGQGKKAKLGTEAR